MADLGDLSKVGATPGVVCDVFPKPKWIWPGPWVDLVNRYAHYRYDFDLSQVPSSTMLHVTADQSYQLWINGTYICRGPARGYQAHWPVDEVDVSRFLRPGHNWISVVAHTPGVSTFQYLHHKAAGLLLWIDEPGFQVVTDDSWLCRMDTSHAVNTPHFWVPLSFQEHVDLNLDDRKWIMDAAPPTEGWHAPKTVRPWGSPPWHAFEPRSMPLLTTEVKPYQRVCSVGQGPAVAQDQDREPTAQFFAELPSLTWQPTEQGLVEDDRLCFDVPAVKADQLVAMVLDMGQPTIGEFLLEIQATASEETSGAGGEVDVLFCETLDAQGQPDFCDPDTSLIRMATRLTFGPNARHFEAFQILGHRYAILVMRGPSQPLQLKAALRETIYPLPIEGAFETDNAIINDIHRICVRTQKICMLDSYVDTPWREQAQWWGDARVQAWNTFHLSNDTRLLRRGIRQIGDPAQALPNGLTYGHAPTIAHNCVLPDFTLIWMLTMWDDYFQTGQTTMFEELWPRVEQALGYFTGEGCDGRTGLLRYDPRYWLFLDWSAIPKEGMPTLLNLWYFHTLSKLITLAEIASMDQAFVVLKPLRDQSFDAIMRELFVPAQGLFHDGLTESGQARDTFSIHNQTLAILAGLAPEHHAAMVQEMIEPYLLGQVQLAAEPSSYWMTYVYTVAQQRGLGTHVLDHLVKHWSPMIASGGTWEKGGGTALPGAQKPGRVSVSHAWSAHPIYHLAQTLGGITQTQPGWERIRFEPVLNWASTAQTNVTIPSPRGPIVSQWNRNDTSQIQVDLTLPSGVTADIHLPAVEPVTMTGPQTQRFHVMR